jgi:hypothetical protein
VKKKVKKKVAVGEKKVEQPAPSQVLSQEQFNYGGLPSRDLKKNLGCG